MAMCLSLRLFGFCRRSLLLLGISLACQAADEGSAMVDGLQWALETNGADVPWAEAEDWCEALELAGREDWRLPTLAELEGLHDPGAGGEVYIESPLPGDTCCLWSATTLEDVPREEDDFYIGPRLDDERYAWGYLYSNEGLRYYSSKGFPDGQALCVTEP